MSDDWQIDVVDRMAASRGEPTPMQDRLHRIRDLAEAAVSGARATAQSTASTAAKEAEAGGCSAEEAVADAAGVLGAALANALLGAARSSGAVAGGLKGMAGGLLLAAQIGGAAADEALRSLAGSSARAAGRMAEGLLLGLEDQEMGEEVIRQATHDLAREVFDAASGAALAALGSLATAGGAVTGGARGAAQGAAEGLGTMADAGAEATWVIGKETARGSTEVLRRALQRGDEEQ